jgi:outer membrane lipoprotein LolB
MRAAAGRARPAFVGAAFAALLTACATPPPLPAGTVTSGRLLLRVAAIEGRDGQNVSAAFELQGNASQGELRLLSPLGTQMAAARWAPGEVSLLTAEGTQRFANLDELSRQALGEALPLAALPDWLAGRPWPQLPHRMQAQGFEQAGWQVLLERQSEGLIEARRQAPLPEVLLRVRLDPAP